MPLVERVCISHLAVTERREFCTFSAAEQFAKRCVDEVARILFQYRFPQQLNGEISMNIAGKQLAMIGAHGFSGTLGKYAEKQVEREER